MEQKILIKMIVANILIMGVLFFAIRTHFDNKYTAKTYEETIKKLKDSLNISNSKIDKVIHSNTVRNRNVIKTKKRINNQKQKDEKEIDSIDISDDELFRYISKHQKR